MDILYATDHSSYLLDGKVYLSSRIYPILKRYADNFGNIILYSRFIETDSLPEDVVNADFIKGYVRVNGLLKTLITKDIKLNNAVIKSDLVVGRVPSIPSYKALDYAKRERKPYFTEAMGCAWDAYWNHGIVGKLIAPYMYFKMRRLIKNADYASYVTSKFLQRRYPRKKSSVSASNVLIEEIKEDILSERLRKIEKMPRDKITIMTTAAVDVKYKGQRYVIEAIPKINKFGIKVKYLIVGDGKPLYLKGIAEKYQVADQVVFTGKKSLNEVFKYLDETDIYLQPSLQEGLPRSVIEAMSRGCIVIGARTAGIPELLEEKYVANRKSSKDIARIILHVCKDTRMELKKNAIRNFNESQKYYYKVLDKRRNDYYQSIKNEIIENKNK